MTPSTTPSPRFRHADDREPSAHRPSPSPARSGATCRRYSLRRSPVRSALDCLTRASTRVRPRRRRAPATGASSARWCSTCPRPGPQTTNGSARPSRPTARRTSTSRPPVTTPPPAARSPLPSTSSTPRAPTAPAHRLPVNRTATVVPRTASSCGSPDGTDLHVVPAAVSAYRGPTTSWCTARTAWACGDRRSTSRCRST